MNPCDFAFEVTRSPRTAAKRGPRAALEVRS